MPTELAAPPNSRIGYGCDPDTGQIKSLALSKPPTQTTAVSNAGITSTGFFKVIDSFQQLSEFLNFDLSAGYGWMTGSVQAHASILASTQFSSHTITVFGQARVSLPTQLISEEPVLSNEASALLNEGKGDQFFDRFGSHFIDGFILGGELLVLLCIQVNDLRQKQSLQASLSLSGLEGGQADASVAQKIDKQLRDCKTELFISSKGGAARQLPFDMETVVNEWRSFLQIATQNPVLDRIILRPYSQLYAGGPLADVIQAARRLKISRLVNLFEQYKRAMNEISRAIDEPDLFYPEIPWGKLQEWQKVCQDKIDKIAELATALQRSDANIDLSVVPPISEVIPQLPQLSLEHGKKVVVSARIADWQDAGLEKDVAVGDLIEFEVLPEGLNLPQRWTVGVPWGWTDADGYPGIADPGAGSPKLPSARFGRLIGRIGGDDSTAFDIGKYRKFHANEKTQGHLYLMCNDNPNHPVGFQDNAGEIVVRLRHRYPPE